MSKKRHRRRREENRSNNTNSNNNNNNNNRQNQNTNFGNPFGINPNQLLSMFGNIDMNQINNMLQSMGTDNIDFNNLNLGSIQNLMSGMAGTSGMPGMAGMPTGSNTGMNQNRSTDEDYDLTNDLDLGPSSTYDDDNIQMLVSLRNFVDDQRKVFIDRIIKVYNEGGLN